MTINLAFQALAKQAQRALSGFDTFGVVVPLMAQRISLAVKVAGFALIAQTSGAFAQDVTNTVPDHRCWLGSKTYTAGIVIKGGDGGLVCNQSGAWEKTESAATGCWYGSDFYSIGASVQRTNTTPLNVCGDDGAWTVVQDEG